MDIKDLDFKLYGKTDDKDRYLTKDDHHYLGILFIGDPMLSSKFATQRGEADAAEVTLSKLSQSLDIAKEQNLLPICLGNMFSRKGENKITFLNSIFSLMKKHGNVLTLVGSHDRSSEGKLLEQDTLSIVRDLGLATVMDGSDFFGEFNINGRKVSIGGTSSNGDIPRYIDSQNEVVWITHHDVDYGQLGARISPYEIQGCSTVVNGRIHGKKKPLTMGQTVWFNPGNILRFSAIEEQNKPSVLAWKSNDKTETIQLQFIPFVFKKEGWDESTTDESLTTTEKQMVESSFIKALVDGASSRDDQEGGMVRSLLAYYISKHDVSESSQIILEGLLQDSLEGADPE